jgi:hypothetical protein
MLLGETGGIKPGSRHISEGRQVCQQCAYLLQVLWRQVAMLRGLQQLALEIPEAFGQGAHGVIVGQAAMRLWTFLPMEYPPPSAPPWMH